VDDAFSHLEPEAGLDEGPRSAATTPSVADRLLRRRCVACGYDGPMPFAGRRGHCDGCGVDLRMRPARSYAEMEGLLGPLDLGLAGDLHLDLGDHPAPGQLAIRWLTVGLGFAMLAAVLIALVIRAFPPV